MKAVLSIGKAYLILSSMVLVIFTAPPATVSGRQNGLVFSTWDSFEADKCASIWLIKRFVDPQAVVRFFPKGEDIGEGIPFDTPDAKLRRYHNMSTFESILKAYRLKNPRLTYIGKIIHDIEINVWERKVMEESSSVQAAVADIITHSASRDEIIKKSVDFFDSLYNEIPVRKGSD